MKKWDRTGPNPSLIVGVSSVYGNLDRCAISGCRLLLFQKTQPSLLQKKVIQSHLIFMDSWIIPRTRGYFLTGNHKKWTSGCWTSGLAAKDEHAGLMSAGSFLRFWSILVFPLIPEQSHWFYEQLIAGTVSTILTRQLFPNDSIGK